MEIVKPTPIKFEGALKKALQEFANKNELGNVSAVVKKAVIKYIGYNSTQWPIKKETK